MAGMKLVDILKKLAGNHMMIISMAYSGTWNKVKSEEGKT